MQKSSVLRVYVCENFPNPWSEVLNESFWKSFGIFHSFVTLPGKNLRAFTCTVCLISALCNISRSFFEENEGGERRGCRYEQSNYAKTDVDKVAVERLKGSGWHLGNAIFQHARIHIVAVATPGLGWCVMMNESPCDRSHWPHHSNPTLQYITLRYIIARALQ